MKSSTISEKADARKETVIIRELTKRLHELIGSEFSGNMMEFVRATGTSRNVWDSLLKSGTSPRAVQMAKVAEWNPDVAYWLLTGKRTSSTAPHIIQLGHEDPEIVSEAAAEERLDTFIPIRILADPVAMGPGMHVSDGTTGGYAVIHEDALPKIARHQKRRDEKIVCLWARGDSMNPTIQPGALVAVDLRANDVDEVEDRKIYVVWLPDGGVTIKRVVRRDGQLILIADNHDAEDFPMILSAKDAERAIRGKVVWWWSKQE